MQVRPSCCCCSTAASFPVIYWKDCRCLPAICTFWLPTVVSFEGPTPSPPLALLHLLVADLGTQFLQRLMCMLFCQLSALRQLLGMVLIRLVLPRCCKAPAAIWRRLARCYRRRSKMDRGVTVELEDVALAELDVNLDRV